MALNLSPHQYAVDPNTQNPILTRVQPYIRIHEGTDPPMFLQAGNVYSEGGGLVHEQNWPAWLPGMIERLSPGAKEETGFQDFVQISNKPLAAPMKKGT
jgi:hypothetical protein